MTESPLAEYDAQIDDLRTQMAPLQSRISAIAKERREYADLLAEETDDPQVLAALREASQVAHKKFETHVRATTHEGIWATSDWLPIEDDYSTGYLLAPHLGIKQDADDAYLSALRDSMLDFADRFCNPAPELVEWQVATYAGVDLSDMVFAAMLSTDQGRDANFAMFYSLDGERAYLFDAYRLGEVQAEGTLSAVLDVAAKVAYYAR